MLENKILDDFKKQLDWANETLAELIKELFDNKTKEDIFPLVIVGYITLKKAEQAKLIVLRNTI